MSHKIAHFLNCGPTQIAIIVEPCPSVFLQMLLKDCRRVYALIAERTTILEVSLAVFYAVESKSGWRHKNCRAYGTRVDFSSWCWSNFFSSWIWGSPRWLLKILEIEKTMFICSNTNCETMIHRLCEWKSPTKTTIFEWNLPFRGKMMHVFASCTSYSLTDTFKSV